MENKFDAGKVSADGACSHLTPKARHACVVQRVFVFTPEGNWPEKCSFL